MAENSLNPGAAPGGPTSVPPGGIQPVDLDQLTWAERHHGSIRACRLYARTFARNGSAMLGLVLVLFFFIIAAIGPWIVPFPEDAAGAVHMDLKLQPPSAEHLFGTDEVGNDVFSRVVLGTRLTLKIALIITGVALLIGVPLGMIAGYVGGWVQEVIMRITDIFLGVPGLILAIAIVGALGPGITNAMLALSLVWWPGYVRLVQAKTLSVKNEIYVDAARSMGASPLRIVFIHILPNCTSPIIVKASMDMGMSILGAASLGFLGLGAQPPEPEWGAMISVARNYLPDWWWYSFFPGAAIFITVMGFNLLGDGLRDILDPKHRE
jgi:peptide/nickel transport system permease protein